MTDLAKCTWPEAEALFGPRTVAILPVGSTEPHGPHLPLDTDVTIAVAMAKRAEARLAEAKVPCVVLPALAYGLTNYTSGFAGRITLRSGTLWMVLEDIVTSLEQQGVTRIVFANAHLEPAHMQVLRGVLLDHATRGKDKAQVIFPDNTRRRFADTFGAEFKSGDCHAGRYESSLVLAADPDAVREAERKQLPPVTIHLIEKMKAGVHSFREAGAEDAYCGDPAAASAAEGRELIERLSDMTLVSIREAWPDLFENAAT
ncbi:MAG: creatininase family protein [Planctomycetota bacterium]|nr:creatininase family protein [Planctomycetota bacterium]